MTLRLLPFLAAGLGAAGWGLWGYIALKAMLASPTPGILLFHFDAYQEGWLEAIVFPILALIAAIGTYQMAREAHRETRP